MARKKRPTDTVQLKLRFPEGLRRELVKTALANERSLNSEIVHILTSAVVARDVMETYRTFAQTAAEAAANEVVGKLEALLRSWRVSEAGFLGHLNKPNTESGND